ncbi:hypothetical protein PPUJ20028_46360 [Pseudomonas putida]|nr:hypothetical protein PPUJ20028_46360 [Pseudomonas putida]
MLKMVPDPPHILHSLEDTIIQAAEHAVCALAISQQAMLMQPKSPSAVLMMGHPMSLSPCVCCLSPH